MGKAVTETAARAAVLKGESIELYGLKLRGIPMGRYEEWAACKNVWLARQSTFPVFCVAYPFLEALWALDMDAIEKVGKPVGFLFRAMQGIGLALGFDGDCVRDSNISASIDEQTRKLNGIVVHEKGREDVVITPQMFDEFRKIVAWMQGDEVPDESLNDELLETEKDLASRNAPNLRYDLLDMEASVAAVYGMRIKDVMEWTILEFEYARKAIDRQKKHLIFGIGETNGCKWDSGNPCPSWCFDRDRTGTSALVSQADFIKPKINKKE